MMSCTIKQAAGVKAPVPRDPALTPDHTPTGPVVEERSSTETSVRVTALGTRGPIFDAQLEATPDAQVFNVELVMVPAQAKKARNRLSAIPGAANRQMVFAVLATGGRGGMSAQYYGMMYPGKYLEQYG